MTKTNLKTGDLKKIGKFFIYCGLVIVLTTIFLSIKKFINLSSNFVPTQAKIVNVQSYRTVSNKSQRTAYITTIEFFIDGYIVTSQQNFHINKQGEIGEIIPILYEVKNPSNINVNRFHYLWGFSEFFAVAGFINIFLGIWIYKKEKTSINKFK